jgi:hypothetical protein
MSQEERFEQLLREFERVGVDPNALSAGLAVSEDDVRRVLAELPDGAGPAAFLHRLRVVMTQPPKQ